MPGEDKKWQIDMGATAARTPPPSTDATIPESRPRQISIEGDVGERARLGPYAILKEIGRGGQGVVYLAEDARLGRQVALKILAGVFTSDSWSRLRFEREATATARLDHPGICTVYEAGTIDQTPFIAMRVVTGESLAARIARTRAEQRPRKPTSSVTSGRQRREALFADIDVVEKVARALHVAHDAGLVHRDVKPGNVMVESSGQPVVLDFGLARDAKNADLLLTGTGAFLGTPPYMSPEQVDGTGTVDRRTDIWSLGVMLYEIATGTRPFEAPTIEGLLRAIRTAEPPDPRKLNSAVTPELSAVILHALEKDRSHRYQDALALADDLGRARRLEPVRARAPSPLMRLWRWAQRNPVVAASLVIVIVGLSVALGISLSALGTARDALAREGVALVEAREQRGRAEDLLSFMLVDMKARLEDVGRLDLLGKVARKASDYFATRPLDFDQPAETLSRALSIRNVGDVLKSEGDVMAAVGRYEEACRIDEELWRRDPKNAAALKALAQSTHALAVAAMVRGDQTECVARAVRSLDLLRKLVDLTPDDCESKAMLVSGMVMHANALKFADKASDAIPIYRDAIERWEKLCEADTRPARRRDLAVTLQNFGEARRITGDLGGAIESRLRGLALFESIARDEPANRDWQEQVATTHHGIAMAENGRDAFREGVAHSKQAVAIFRRLSAEDPINTRRLYQLGVALHALATNHSDAIQKAEALDAFQEAAGVRTRLVALDPRNRSWRSDLADNQRAIGLEVASMGRTEEALGNVEAAVNLFRALTTEKADDAYNQGRLAIALSTAADLLRELGRPSEALDRLLEAVEAATAECSGPKPSVRALRTLALRLENAANAAGELGDHKRAREILARGIERRRNILSLCAESDRPRSSRELGSALVTLGEWQEHDGDAKAACTTLQEAITLLQDGRAQAKDKNEVDCALVRGGLARAEAEGALGDLGGAEASAARAKDVFDQVPEGARSASDAIRVRARLDLARRLRGVLAESRPHEAADHEALARHLVATGRPAEAIAEFVPAIASSRDAPETLRLRTLEAAIVAAARVASASPDQAARVEPLALAWIEDGARILVAGEKKLASRALEQAKKGTVDDAVREELAEIRCRLAALRVHDPALAPFRKLPGFEAAVAGKH